MKVHRSGRRELDRVAQQVVQDLTQTRPVGQRHDGHIHIVTAGELQALFCGDHRKHVQAIFRQVAQIHLPVLKLHLARVQLGPVQHIIEHGQQAARALRHQIKQLLLLRGRQMPGAQQRQGANHAVQGRADFVADGGQKTLFDLFALTRLATRLLQCIQHAAAPLGGEPAKKGEQTKRHDHRQQPLRFRAGQHQGSKRRQIGGLVDVHHQNLEDEDHRHAQAQLKGPGRDRDARHHGLPTQRGRLTAPLQPGHQGHGHKLHHQDDPDVGIDVGLLVAPDMDRARRDRRQARPGDPGDHPRLLEHPHDRVGQQHHTHHGGHEPESSMGQPLLHFLHPQSRRQGSGRIGAVGRLHVHVYWKSDSAIVRKKPRLGAPTNQRPAPSTNACSLTIVTGAPSKLGLTLIKIA